MIFILLTGAFMLLLLNQLDAGEGWYLGVLKGLGLMGLLTGLAIFAPGATLLLSLIALASLLASELYLNDRRKRNAADRYARFRRQNMTFSTVTAEVRQNKTESA